MCEHELEVEQSIKKPMPNRKKCPKCNKNKLSRVLFAPHVYNKPGDDNITVGLLADRNAARLTDEQKNSIDLKSGRKKNPKSKDKNFWDTSEKNLKQISEMSSSQKKKYIETGKNE